MPDPAMDELFTDALAVVNRSLAANRDHALFGRILELADEHLEGHRANMVVYQDDPAERRAFFTVRWSAGHLELLTRGKGPHESEWKVSTEWLRSVRDDPERYVRNPALLDLDWLATRIPDGLRQLGRMGPRAPE